MVERSRKQQQRRLQQLALEICPAGASAKQTHVLGTVSRVIGRTPICRLAEKPKNDPSVTGRMDTRTPEESPGATGLRSMIKSWRTKAASVGMPLPVGVVMMTLVMTCFGKAIRRPIVRAGLFASPPYSFASAALRLYRSDFPQPRFWTARQTAEGLTDYFRMSTIREPSCGGSNQSAEYGYPCG